MVQSTFNKTSEKVFSKLRDNTIKYLNRVMPGAYGRVNWHSLRAYGEDFLDLLFTKPLIAYSVVLEVYGASEGHAKHFIYMILKGLFMGRREYVEKAFRALLDRDRNGFLEVLKSFLNHIRT